MLKTKVLSNIRSNSGNKIVSEKAIKIFLWQF